MGKIIINPKTDLLLITDATNTFFPKNELPVTNGDLIVPVIVKVVEKFDPDSILNCHEEHPPDHSSYARTYIYAKEYTKLTYSQVKNWTERNHDLSAHVTFNLHDFLGYMQILNEIDLWPVHALKGTNQVALHPGLQGIKINLRFLKATHPLIDSYSDFEDALGRETGLSAFIHKKGFKRIFHVGLARDYCVGWSAIHSTKYGFESYLIEDGTKPVGLDKKHMDKMEDRMHKAGVKRITSDDLA